MDQEDEFDRDYSNDIIRFEQSLLGDELGFMDSDTFEYIINYYISNFNFEKAKICSEIALKYYPSHSSFIFKKVVSLIHDALFIDAMNLLNKIETLETYNIEFYITKALLFFEMKLNKKAIDLINKSLYKFDIEDKEELILFLAEKLYLNGNFEESLKFYYKVQNINKNNEQSLKGILNCHILLKKQESAILFFNNYLDENPYSSSAWYYLSELYKNIEDYEKAIWAIEFCLAIDEDNFGAIFQLACNYMYNEQYNKAIEYFELYFENEDFILESDYCLLAECYENLANLTKAKELYLKSLELNVDYSDAWLGLGIVSDLEDDTLKAIEYINKAIDIEPDRFEFYHILANAYVKIEDFENALESFDNALALTNEDAETYIDFFEFYMNQFGFKNLKNEIKKYSLHSDLYYVEDFILFRSYMKRKEIEKSELFLDYICQKYPEKLKILLEFYPDINDFNNLTNILNKYLK